MALCVADDQSAARDAEVLWAANRGLNFLFDPPARCLGGQSLTTGSSLTGQTWAAAHGDLAYIRLPVRPKPQTPNPNPYP